MTALQKRYDALNADIVTLRTLVEAIQKRDNIKEITPLPDGSGYTLTLAKYGTITIRNGEKGAAGHDPVIGVRKDSDGIYYWTIDGEWLLDGDKKVKAEGIDGANGIDGQNGSNGKDGAQGASGQDGATPELKIEDGYWYVSYNKGETWQQLGKASGEEGAQGQPGDSLFKSIDVSDPYNVVITLLNGTVLYIPKGPAVISKAQRLDENGIANCYIVSSAGSNIVRSSFHC